MRKNKHLILIGALLALVSAVSLYAQQADTGSDAGNRKKEEPAAATEDERRDVLRYGIDSEVISVLDAIKAEDDHTLDDEILNLLNESRNPTLRAAAVRVLSQSKYKPAMDAVKKILQSYPDDEELITSSIDFLIAFDDTQDVSLLSDYLTDRKVAVALKAVEGLGHLGGAEQIKQLKDLYDNAETPQAVRAAAIAALGMLKDSESIPFLEKILGDPTQEKSFRWRACQALGEIGDQSALPAIRKALSDDDTILRTYAIRALQAFDSSLVLSDLMEALRDSFWRVRLAAIETLGERQEKDAVDILMYKATRDPEEKIRISAITALGKIGGKKSFDALRDIAVNGKYSPGMRVAAIQVVVQDDLSSSFDMIDKIIETEWSRSNSRIFIELVKAMTREEHPKLSGYFEHFLTYNNVSVVLMALKGIEKNHFTGLRETVQKLSESRTAGSIKKMSKEVLDSF